MKLLIDADACPVVDASLAQARQRGIEVLLFCDTAHQFEREGARTAGERLGLDARLPWPEGAETLRELFQTLPAMEDPPDADYVYIEAPMPADSGYAYCAAGIRAEGGVPASVRYALPAAWTPEPPAGLEDYRWVGDQNRGWWVAEVAVY